MTAFVFYVLIGLSIASLAGALLELLSARRERRIARERALRDHDPVLAAPSLLEAALHRDVADGFPGEDAGWGQTNPAVRIRLFALGLVAWSLIALALGLGFAGTFLLVLVGSLALSAAATAGGPRARVLAVLLLAGLAACGSDGPRRNQIQGTHNTWVARDLRQRQITAAVVADSTLTERHFATRAAELNELGQRDTKILAAQLRDHGGAVQVRRGGASDELYGARLSAVALALSEAAGEDLTLEITRTGVEVVSAEAQR